MCLSCNNILMFHLFYADRRTIRMLSCLYFFFFLLLFLFFHCAESCCISLFILSDYKILKEWVYKFLDLKPCEITQNKAWALCRVVEGLTGVELHTTFEYRPQLPILLCPPPWYILCQIRCKHSSKWQWHSHNHPCHWSNSGLLCENAGKMWTKTLYGLN